MKSILKAEEYGLGFILLSIAILMCMQVILRYFFAYSILWAEELMRHLMVLMIFFAASWGIKKGKHIGMDALVKGVSTRNRSLIESISSLLVTILSAFLTYYSIIFVAKAKQFGQTTSTLLIPVYLVYGIFPASFAIITIRSVVQAVRHIKVYNKKG